MIEWMQDWLLRFVDLFKRLSRMAQYIDRWPLLEYHAGSLFTATRDNHHVTQRMISKRVVGFAFSDTHITFLVSHCPIYSSEVSNSLAAMCVWVGSGS